MRIILIISLIYCFEIRAQDCSRVLAKKQFQTAARLKMPAKFSFENLTKTIYLRNELSQMLRTNRLIKEVRAKKIGQQTKYIVRKLSGFKNKRQVVKILEGIQAKNGFCSIKRTRRGKKYFSYLRMSQIILGMKKNVFYIKGKGPLIHRQR